MTDNADKKTVLLYAGEDVVDLLVLNRLVPEMVEMGLSPVIIFPEKPKLKSPNLANPDVQEYGFYQHDILQETIVPFLDSKPIVLDNNGKLKPDTCYTARQLADFYGLEIRHIKSVNAADHVKSISSDDTIIGALSVRCMQIFKSDTIEAIQKKGFFWNAHPGGLPDYRGVIPVFRAMLNGDKNLKWTVHTVDEGIDTGPKHATTSQKVDSRMSVFWHYNTNADNVAAMILGLVQDNLNGRQIERIVQSRSKGNYYSYPEVELTNDFNRKGGALVEPRSKMEAFLSKIFVPMYNPHRDEFKHIVSKAITDRFGPKNAGLFTLGHVARPNSDEPSARMTG